MKKFHAKSGNKVLALMLTKELLKDPEANKEILSAHKVDMP